MKSGIVRQNLKQAYFVGAYDALQQKSNMLNKLSRYIMITFNLYNLIITAIFILIGI